VEFVTQTFGFGDHLSKSTALGGVNALVQCKEGQVFAVPTVTLVREGFSTNFSTFLLKSFDRGDVVNRREVRMREYERLEKRKNFPFALVRSLFGIKSFSRRFF
jgi:hypothetical protein